MLQRQGMSRVDALIGTLIAVLVVGLILAGVARVRDAADRASCEHNLRTLALCTNNLADQHSGRLPVMTDLHEGSPTGRGLMSVFSMIVPYIESGPLRFDYKRSPPAQYHAHSSVPFTIWGDEAGECTMDGGLANGVWRTFTDPSDATTKNLRDIPMTLPDRTTGYYATGSYAANGLIPWNTGLWPTAFPRGTSTTILFSERPQVCRTAADETIYNLWGVGFYSPNMPAFAALTPADPPGLWPTGMVAPVEPLPSEGAKDRDARIRLRVGRRDADPGPPDFASPIQIIRSGRPCDPRLPGSPHRGGLQAAMADGSVRLFAPDTSPWVFWAACSPAEPR